MKKTIKNDIVRSIVLYVTLILLALFTEIEIVPNRFPLHAATTFYYLALLTVLLFYFFERIADRGKLRNYLLRCVFFMIFFILLRGAKYEAFPKLSTLSRYVWYLYYLPMLLLPLYTLLGILGIESKKESKKTRTELAFTMVTYGLILFVLTNDFHQWVFRFQPGFWNWDKEYERGIVYYVIVFWNYFMYLLAVYFMIRKCRLASARKLWWVTLLPLFTGIALLLVIANNRMPVINGNKLIEFPEVTCFMIALFWESCMRLGLIPTNKGYGELLRNSSLAMQIMDGEGKAVYRSKAARSLTSRQWKELSEGDGRPVSLDENTCVYREKIPGGFSCWQDDVAEINRLNRELEEVSSRLSEEAELIRLENELKEKQESIQQRTRLYDRIAEKTRRQTEKIKQLSMLALESTEEEVKRKNAGIICFLGAYVKRYANLTLLSERDGAVHGAELGMALAESLRYLGNAGIPGDYMGSPSAMLPAGAVLACYEAFEILTEQAFEQLSAVYATITESTGEILLKLTLEGVRTKISEELKENLGDNDIRVTAEIEDDVSYVRLMVPKMKFAISGEEGGGRDA